MKRDHWQRRIERLDPEVDFAEIYRVMATHEFPWDMTQSLGLALYRSYAVPSIGGCSPRPVSSSGGRHKRYADTGLILDAVIEHGLRCSSDEAALRHGATHPRATAARPPAEE